MAQLDKAKNLFYQRLNESHKLTNQSAPQQASHAHQDMDISPQMSPELSLSTWKIPTIEGEFPSVPVHLDAHPDTYPPYDQDPTVYKYLQEDSYLAFCTQSSCTHHHKHFVIRADTPDDNTPDIHLEDSVTQDNSPLMYDFFSQPIESPIDIDFDVVDVIIAFHTKQTAGSTSRGLAPPTSPNLAL